MTVYFFDAQWRWYLKYSFQEKKPATLFLSLAIFREFIGDTDDVMTMKSFAFSDTGKILVEDKDLIDGVVEEREIIYSVEENWLDYPRFGDYAHLCFEQRSK